MPVPIATRETHTAFLLEMSRLLNGSLPPERRVKIALSLLSHWVGLHYGRIMLPDHREQVLRVAFHHGLPATELALDRYTVPMSQGLTGHVWRNGQAAMVADIFNEPIFLRRIAVPMRGTQHKIGFICVPMKLESRTIGVLSAQRLPDPRHLYSDDIDLMRIVSSMLAPVLQNLHVQAQSEQDQSRDDWVSYSTLHPRRPRTYRRVQDADVHSIEAALKHAGGNQSQAARLLGMTPRQLRYRLKKLKIGGYADQDRVEQSGSE